MAEYRVTFGIKYSDPDYPRPAALPNVNYKGWVTIEAPDELSARIFAIETFGRDWAFMYAADDVYDQTRRPWDESFPHGEFARFVAPSEPRTHLHHEEIPR